MICVVCIARHDDNRKASKWTEDSSCSAHNTVSELVVIKSIFEKSKTSAKPTDVEISRGF